MAEPTCLLLQLELCFLFFCFFLLSPLEKKGEGERWKNEGVLKPLWNNACKHRQCITQVMRFSTLLKSKAPQHLRRTNTLPSALSQKKHTHAQAHTLSHSPYLLFSFSSTLLSLPSPLCEFGQAVCMQICHPEDPPAQFTHTHTHIHTHT